MAFDMTSVESQTQTGISWRSISKPFFSNLSFQSGHGISSQTLIDPFRFMFDKLLKSLNQNSFTFITKFSMMILSRDSRASRLAIKCNFKCNCNLHLSITRRIYQLQPGSKNKSLVEFVNNGNCITYGQDGSCLPHRCQ